jgi:5-methylcytosine-specific restriction endonuclease McrA
MTKSVSYSLLAYGPDWAAKSLAVKRRAGFQCERILADGTRCPVKGRLEAHHITYENFGAEGFADLVAVCSKCHDAIHNRGLRNARPGARK